MDPSSMAEEMARLCDAFDGAAGFYIEPLDGGWSHGHNQERIFPSASTIKTAVMLVAVRAVDEGRLKWTDKRPVPPIEQRELSMWAYFLKEGLEIDVDGWINLMITLSDNTATILLRDWLGTMSINRALEDLGLLNTKILGNAPPDATYIRELWKTYGMGMTTPKEMAHLMKGIALGTVASRAGCERMVRILSHQYWDHMIAASIPPGVVCACKSGFIERSRSDNAIVYGPTPYVLSVYTDNIGDQSWGSGNAARRLIQQISAIAWRTMAPEQPYTPPEGWLAFYPTGAGVDDTV